MSGVDIETAVRELRAHLRRLAIGSLASAGVGLGLALVWQGDFGRGFAGMTLGWSLVNLAIVAASRRGHPPASVARFREFLMLNQGLNAGYVGVGLALGLAAPSGSLLSGLGWAVVPQGLLLAALDGYLLSRLR